MIAGCGWYVRVAAWAWSAWRGLIPVTRGPNLRRSDVSVVDDLRYELLLTSVSGVPARAVLERAEALRDQLGHENHGFLSVRRGFAPYFEPVRQLPAEFGAWDEAAARLPELYRSLRLRRELDSLPLLDAGPDSLPDKYLLRAALTLGL